MKKMTLHSVFAKSECVAEIKAVDLSLTPEIITKILPDIMGSLGLVITKPRKWFEGVRGLNIQTASGIMHVEKNDDTLRVYTTAEQLMLIDNTEWEDWDSDF